MPSSRRLTVRVVYFATYLTRVDSSWRDEDHNASKFVKAIKGKPFNGYASIPVGCRVERLTTTNSASAVDWFAEMAAAWLKRNFASGTAFRLNACSDFYRSQKVSAKAMTNSPSSRCCSTITTRNPCTLRLRYPTEAKPQNPARPNFAPNLRIRLAPVVHAGGDKRKRFGQ